MENLTVGERIKEIRKDRNLTQEAFSLKIKLSRNFISQIESGTKVASPRTIKDICREFNINEDWLIYGIGPMERQSDDDFSEIVEDMLSEDNPFYDLIKDIAITYKGLDPASKTVIQNFAQQLLDGRQKKKEG